MTTYTPRTKELLGQLREKGWSCQNIADAIHVKRNAVDRWHRGVVVPLMAFLVDSGLDVLVALPGPPAAVPA